MPEKPFFAVRLADDVQQGLELYAKRANLPPEQAIGDLVAKALSTPDVLPELNTERIEAEQNVFRHVAQFVDRYRQKGSWPENITLLVFRSLQDSLLADYQKAIAGGHKIRVNRKIGSTVRFRLQAEVKMENGRRDQRQVSRKESALIKSYTALVPPTEGNSND